MCLPSPQTNCGPQGEHWNAMKLCTSTINQIFLLESSPLQFCTLFSTTQLQLLIYISFLNTSQMTVTSYGHTRNSTDSNLQRFKIKCIDFNTHTDHHAITLHGWRFNLKLRYSTFTQPSVTLIFYFHKGRMASNMYNYNRIKWIK